MTLKISEITGYDFDKPINGKVTVLVHFGDEKWIEFKMPAEDQENIEELFASGSETASVAIPKAAFVNASWFQPGWMRTSILGHGES